MKRISTFALGIVVAGAWATATSAQHLTIQSHIGSTEHTSRFMSRTYDDSGMSGDSGSAGATNDTHSTDQDFHMGLLNGDTPPLFIEYDLGQSYALTNLVIWNSNEPTWWKQGMKTVTITVREFGGTPTNVFSGDIPQPPAHGMSNSTPSIDIDLTGITGRFIHFLTAPLPDQNWRVIVDGATNDVACALSEVRVYGDPTGLGNGTTEACCFPDGSCQDLEPADCTTAGGTPDGVGTECFTTVCPQLFEACCFDDGNCLDMDPNDCLTAGGIPQGSGSNCAGASCEQPDGCCFSDGTCEDLPSSLCVAAGGTPADTNGFTTCAGTSCPQLEACCFDAAPWCTNLTPGDCENAGGTRGGLGTLCATHDCLGGIEVVATNAVEMGVLTYNGYRYDVERATGLNPDDFADLNNSYVMGNDTTRTLVGDDGGAPDRFYRWAGFQPPNPCGIAPAIGNPSAGNGWSTTSNVTVRASNEKVSREWIHAIDGTGISADGCTHTDCLEDDCFADGSTFNTMGFNQGPMGPARAGTVPGANWVEFGFDQIYPIVDILLWNYNEDNQTPGAPPGGTTWSIMGMKEVTIQYTSVDNGAGWGSDNSIDWTTLTGGTMLLDKGTGGSDLIPQVIALNDSARYVVITAVNGTNANFMCDFLGGALCTTNVSVEGALSEVRFTLAAPPSPPPALPPAAIDPVILADVPGLSFLSTSGVVYELERSPQIIPDVALGKPQAASSWDTQSEVSLHTAVAGGYSGQHSATRGAIHTIDGGGIDSGPGDETDLHNNTVDDNMWLGNANGGNPRGGSVAGSNWIAFDVGSVREIVGMHIWNYNEAPIYATFGMKEVTIEYSATGSTDTNDWSVYYDGQIPQASSDVPSGAELVIDNTVTGRYFVITADSGSDENWSNGAFVGQDGLSEVRFLRAGVLLGDPVGSPNLGNAWTTTGAVSIDHHSGEPGGADRAAINAINGTGIHGDAGEFHGTAVSASMWLARISGPGVPGTGGVAQNPGQAVGNYYVTYAFDQPYDLASVDIWNWNENPNVGFGWKHLEIQVSTNNGTNPSDWTTVFAGILPIGSAAASAVASASIPLGGVSAQYVAIINTGLTPTEENWSNGTFTNDAGLSEVRFYLPAVGPPDIGDAVFEGTGSFTVGDDAGGVQTLYDPDGWDTNNWYRVVPQ